MNEYDIVVIGAGHNGLIAGCYLEKAGLDVGIFEANEQVGGGLHTESFEENPGFRRNHHAIHLGGILQSPIRKDLNLERHGAQLIHPEVKMTLPLSDGRALVLYDDPHATRRSIREFSERDAKRYEELYYKWNRMSYHFQQPEWYNPPKSLSERRRQYTSQLGQEYLDLCERPPVEIIKEEFENEHVRALFTGIVMAAGGRPFEKCIDGLLVRSFNRRHNLCISRGGSQTFAQALANCFEAAGGNVHTGCEVAAIDVERGRVSGVVLNDGTCVPADIVVSNVHYPQTYLDLVGPEHLPESFITQVRDEYELSAGSLFGVHLALEDAPEFVAAEHNPDVAHAARHLFGSDTLTERQEVHAEIKNGELPEQPLLNAGSVSVIDPTQAPPGQHTAHMWAAVPWAPEDNSPAHWNDVKSEYASTCLEQFARYAPNIDETNIVETHVHTPIDARRAHPNMLTGHPEGAPGQQRVDQPDFRGPIDGLYLSGAPTHPGGNVCGAPGYNCAGIILDDRDIEKWWTPPVPGV